MARELVEAGQFYEVFVDTPIELCRQRDPKGLYKKADAGKIANFTGISSPYEPPANPEFWVETSDKTPEEAANIVVDGLNALFY